MLHIILLILKIILFIILGILGLLLLIVGLLLFSPIRYKADVKYKDKAKVKAKIRFLCVSVNVLYDQEKKEVTNILRIFGIRLGKKKDKQENHAKKHKKSKRKKDDFDDFEDDSFIPLIEYEAEEKNDLIDTPDEVVDESSKQSIIEVDEETSDIEVVEESCELSKKEKKKLAKQEKKEKKALKKQAKKDKKQAKKEKNKNKFEAIKQKVLYIKKKYNRFQKFWNFPCTKKTRKYLKKYIPKTLKHIFPRRIKGYLRYGMNEPYKTGKVTGYLSLMPFVYHKHFSICPDFYNKVIETDMQLKGKIRLGYILRIAIHMHVWRTIKAAKRI